MIVIVGIAVLAAFVVGINLAARRITSRWTPEERASFDEDLRTW